VLLHGDVRVLPSARSARASWNFTLSDCESLPNVPQITYDMRRLQPADRMPPLLVTLNMPQRVDPNLVIKSIHYRHPVHTVPSRNAQLIARGISGSLVSFAGSYLGWGFHEDACQAGFQAASAVGGSS
jgi:predicted NAD/FAD-binding protein